MLAKNKPWLPYAVYTFVALLVCAPLLRPGYVLTLDMVFTPHLPYPGMASNLTLYQVLLHWMNITISAQVLQKLIIFVILLGCGIGMHRLVKTAPQIPRYAAGIFYMINPFTYERWMAGQYLIIAGYALLPFLVTSLDGYLRKPAKRSCLFVVGWLTAIALVSVHMLVLAVLLLIIFTVIRLCKPYAEKHYRRQLLAGLAFIAVFFYLFNNFWLYGIFHGSSPITKTIAGIGSTDLASFASAGGHHGLLLNVLSGYGFWLERYNRYAQPQLVVWVLGLVLLGSLIAFGVQARYKDRSAFGLGLGIAAGIGLIIALGVTMPLTGPLIRALILHVPLMRGFREPEKFSALLMLGYAYFLAYGVEYVLTRIRANNELARASIRYGALLLPLLYTATMPFGFVGQLKPVQYPASWYAFKKDLSYQPTKGKLLFLPWHQYMSYDFSPRIIANPAPDFFAPATVIAGTNAEFGGIVDPKPTSTSTFIESQFLDRTNRTDLGSVLAQQHIQYVLLSRGYDYQRYDYLRHQTDLLIISAQPGLTVFKNQAYHG